MPHLYRKSAGYATALLIALVLLFAFLSAEAQRPELKRPHSDDSASSTPPAAKKSKRGPRAIAIVEFLPGGGTRLVPIALLMDGKYYDASLYGASPEPFALEPGTVYEAQENGESNGLFVVNTPKLVNGNWAADGRWTPRAALDAKLAADAAKQPKAKSKDSKAVFTGGPDEGPPVLRRAGAGSPDGEAAQSSRQQTTSQATPPDDADAQRKADKPATAGPSSSANPQAASDSGRPTLKRPSDESTTAEGGSGSPVPSDSNRPVLQRSPASQSSTASPDDDPDRPVLRKPTQPASVNGQTSLPPVGGSRSAGDNDSDRPILSRGSSAGTAPKSSATLATSGAPKPGKSASSQPLRAYPAISDAGTYELRSLLYTLTPEQQQQLTISMLTFARDGIRAFAAQRPGPQIPKLPTITDYDLRVFDLDFSNSPTLVLDAKLPLASGGTKPFAYYATIVARLDINGEAQKIFSSVTDTAHLDVYPRLQLIDAMDADSNGRGDLLFRHYSDIGISYGLYRVFPYQMEKVFEGGSSL